MNAHASEMNWFDFWEQFNKQPEIGHVRINKMKVDEQT